MLHASGAGQLSASCIRLFRYLVDGVPADRVFANGRIRVVHVAPVHWRLFNHERASLMVDEFAG